MQDNPFGNLIEIMREEGKHFNTPSFYFGKIKSGTPNVSVFTNNITLDKRDLLIDKLVMDAGLKQNDLVVLVPYGNKFIIISKVVSI